MPTRKFIGIDKNPVASDASGIWVLPEHYTAVLGSRWPGDAVYALFAGGYTGSARSNVIDYVNAVSTGNATDFGDLTVARNGQATGASSTRAVFAGGYSTGRDNTIDYVTIATTGNATDFGDTTQSGAGAGGASNETRMVMGGRDITSAYYTYSARIEYITIASTGNATNVGNLTVTRGGSQGVQSPTHGIFGGGQFVNSAATVFSTYNTIDYVTFSSLGSATDWGDLTQARWATGNASNSVRGLWAGGVSRVGTSSSSVRRNTIDYITLASAGNAIDFGDLSADSSSNGGAGSPTRALFNLGYPGAYGSNTIEYVEIATTGNTVDFGDLTVARSADGTSSGHGGLGVKEFTSAAIGIFAGGQNGAYYGTMDMIGIATTGNAVFFGNLTVSRGRLAGCGSSTRGLFGGGWNGTTKYNTIDYVTYDSLGGAVDFGDLTTAPLHPGALSSATRGVWGGGEPTSGLSNVIDYVTIASAGNATDFGDLTSARSHLAGCGSSTRGLFGGGWSPRRDVIDYITIATTGNATDFGDLTAGGYGPGAASSSVRALFAGLETGTWDNRIDYVTIATTGNATDFGDLTQARAYSAGVSSGTRAAFGGGSTGSTVNTIDYVEIATTGNATDFGDLYQARWNPGSTSNAHGGLS